MNILDENIPGSQYGLLQNKRLAIRQIGHDVGHKGMKDDELIVFLHRLDRPTFFTFDADFYRRQLGHPQYSLVHLDIEEGFAAEYVVRFLRH